MIGSLLGSVFFGLKCLVFLSKKKGQGVSCQGISMVGSKISCSVFFFLSPMTACLHIILSFSILSKLNT